MRHPPGHRSHQRPVFLSNYTFLRLDPFGSGDDGRSRTSRERARRGIGEEKGKDDGDEDGGDGGIQDPRGAIDGLPEPVLRAMNPHPSIWQDAKEDNMFIDAENYLILARTGHPAERHTVAREYAVGLADAKRIARQMREKHPYAKVEAFWCDGTARILENA